MSILKPLTLIGIALLLFPPEGLHAQSGQVDPEPNARIQDILESLASQSEGTDLDFETFQENLLNYLQEPLDLNKASGADLGDLGLLNGAQIDALQDYRYYHGSLLSIYELQLIPGFDPSTIQSIIPFVTVDGFGQTKLPPVRYLVGGRHRIYARYQTILEDQKGYTLPDSVRHYAGSRAKLYLRYRYQQGNRLSYGFTAEKDPGEEFFSGSQARGFDYYSAHLYLRNQGRLTDLALGDYQILIGQGLTWWSGFGFGKSSSVQTLRRDGRIIAPYTSVNENAFLRGAALRSRIGAEGGLGAHLAVTVWGSHKRLDANPFGTDSLVPGNWHAVSSFVEDGLHRTEAEIARKDAARESIGGVHIGWMERNWTAGLATSHVRYNVDLNPADRPYSKFNFEGDRLTNGTFHYSARLQQFSFFGELAVADNGNFANLHGLQASLHPRVDFAVLYRHYDKAYHAMYANAFAEQSSIGNESGIYLGIQLKATKRISIDAYADLYRHPWLRFRADAPSQGRDFLGQISWSAGPSTAFYLRAKHEVKLENAAQDERSSDFLVPTRRTSLRFNLSARPSPDWRLRSRVEVVWFDNSVEGLKKGSLIFQDLQWTARGLPIRLTVRFTLFDIESFGARIYAYENDVLYQFSIPFFSDRGSRYYLLAKWKALPWLDFYTRYARTGYSNRDTVGSDLDQIEASHRSEFKLMLVFKP